MSPADWNLLNPERFGVKSKRCFSCFDIVSGLWLDFSRTLWTTFLWSWYQGIRLSMWFICYSYVLYWTPHTQNISFHFTCKVRDQCSYCLCIYIVFKPRDVYVKFNYSTPLVCVFVCPLSRRRLEGLYYKLITSAGFTLITNLQISVKHFLSKLQSFALFLFFSWWEDGLANRAA